jgi:hypothetical protein
MYRYLSLTLFFAHLPLMASDGEHLGLDSQLSAYNGSENLDLEGEMIEMSPPFALRLKEFLRETTTVKVFNLTFPINATSQWWPAPSYAKNIFNGLENNKSIKNLSISQRIISVGPGDIDDLVALVKINHTLEEICLGFGEDLGNRHFFLLARALKENTSIKKLNLSFQDIDASQAKFLAAELKDKRDLISIKLTRARASKFNEDSEIDFHFRKANRSES